MNPQYLCDLSFIASCAAAAVTSFLVPRALRRALATGLLLACSSAFLLAPLLLAAEMFVFGEWKNPTWASKTLLTLGIPMGVVAAGLTAPGAGVAVLAGRAGRATLDGWRGRAMGEGRPGVLRFLLLVGGTVLVASGFRGCLELVAWYAWPPLNFCICAASCITALGWSVTQLLRR
jgi:hypothetical protein